MRDQAVADAPGRVNLIGEHTDYHDGFVLPTVIPQRTHVHVVRRTDCLVRVETSALGKQSLSFELGRESRGRGWLDYVQGVTTTLARHGFRIGGFDASIDSTVPVGAGVSSSAALEVSLLRALRQLHDLTFDDVALAKMAQAVETEFVGAPVGIMDQIASSLGRDGEALFLDTRSLAIERIPLPPTIAIAVIDSGVPHANAGGQYAARRRESFEAAHALGVERLRELDCSALPRINALPPLLARRARHIVTENQRVLDAVLALRDGDAPRLGQLFSASHASMRDDYETSTPDVDALVSIADRRPDVFGARLTGGGFGGSVVILTHAGQAASAAREIAADYRAHTGRTPTTLVPPTGSS